MVKLIMVTRHFISFICRHLCFVLKYVWRSKDCSIWFGFEMFVCYLAIVKCVVSHAASVGASLTDCLSILRGVQVRFFLEFTDILLISNTFVAEPI